MTWLIFQSFDTTVMFHGSQKRYFGDGHVRLDLFVSQSSGEKFDGGNMARNLDKATSWENWCILRGNVTREIIDE